MLVEQTKERLTKGMSGDHGVGVLQREAPGFPRSQDSVPLAPSVPRSPPLGLWTRAEAQGGSLSVPTVVKGVPHVWAGHQPLAGFPEVGDRREPAPWTAEELWKRI